MKKTSVALLLAALAALLLLAWAPWLDDKKIHDIVLQEKGRVDGTIDKNGTLICDYNVNWAPFGRWVVSCEGGWYVAFYEEAVPANASPPALISGSFLN